MKVTPDIINVEFIGTSCIVAESTHANNVGISGEIIDESKNTFTIMQDAKSKCIIKDTSVFCFTFSDGTCVKIDGKLLAGRPEDRLKKTVKRLW